MYIRPQLPHIDQIIELDPHKRIVALKNVSMPDTCIDSDTNDPIVVPYTLITECLVQAAYHLLLQNDDLSGQKIQLHTIKNAYIHTPVQPGDQIRLEVEITKEKNTTIMFQGQALINHCIAATCDFTLQRSELPSKRKIHPTASVHPTAIIGKDVVIGPYCIIRDHVTIGDHTTLEAHVMVDKWTRIGAHNHIHFGAVIGSSAQDLKYSGEKAWVEIGDHNEIREYVTINRATGRGQSTIVGSHNMFLTNVHIGHNCTVGDHNVLANMVHVGGHVTIEANVIIGGLTDIHQFSRVGKGSMIGGYSRLVQDVPPFMLCDGNPAFVRSINSVGLRRQKHSAKSIKSIKDAYKILYRSGLNIKQSISEIEAFDDTNELLNHLLQFLKQDSSRGISKKTSEADSAE